MTTTEITAAKIDRVYGNTPKKAAKAIEAARKAAIEEIVARHLPGVTLCYWTPKGGRVFNMAAPAISRVYLNRDGQKVGFAGVKRAARTVDGSYYDAHRAVKGAEHYTTEFVTDLDGPTLAALQAAASEYCERVGEAHRLGDADQFELTIGQLIYTKAI